MERFLVGHVIDGAYRVESLLSETPRAQVYGVTHVRFPENPLALKIPSAARYRDFERDTRALANVASAAVASICDVGKLPDGRMYRVVDRLAGPTLTQLLATSPAALSEQRVLELLIGLAEVVHEAHANALGPCDLSTDNLMFADGVSGRLCMLRVLAPDAEAPNPAGDHAALAQLKAQLVRESSQRRPEVREPWKPPSSMREIRDAMAKTGGHTVPATQQAGARIDDWQVIGTISETVYATVYDVTGPGGMRAALKIAGPRAKHEDFTRHAYTLAQVKHPRVLAVHAIGAHGGAPYFVADRWRSTQAQRLEHGGPLSIDEAIRTIDEMLAAAEVIAGAGAGPTDFALEHCFVSDQTPPGIVISHVVAPLKRFGRHASGAGASYVDAWSAAVALYELLSGRLPFPTSKQSLAKAWMGIPIPLVGRRREVPRALSTLVSDLLVGEVTMTIANLRRSLSNMRALPPQARTGIAHEDPTLSGDPRGPQPPPPARLSPLPPAPSAERGSAPPAIGALKRPNATPRMDAFAHLRGSSAPPRPPVTPPGPPPLGPPLGSPPPGAAYARGSAPPPGSMPPRGSVPPIMSGRGSAPPVVPSVVPPPHLTPVGAAPRHPVVATTPNDATIAHGETVPQAMPAPDWRLDLSPSRAPLGALLAAAMSPDGREIVAVATDAVARYRSGSWTIDPAREGASRVRSLFALGEDAYLALTTSGSLLRLGPAGGFAPWGPALDRFAFHHALVEADGVTLVGGTNDERRRGVLAKLVGESVTIVAENLETRTLLGAARLADGSLLATSEGGSIVRIRGAVIAESLRACELELCAAIHGPRDTLVVGAAAWAFRITTGPLEAHLEPVDTLSTMTCLAMDENGNAWAGTKKGRILRRRSGHWRRMNRDIKGEPAVLALFASPERVRAILADGQIVLGQPI